MYQQYHQNQVQHGLSTLSQTIFHKNGTVNSNSVEQAVKNLVFLNFVMFETIHKLFDKELAFQFWFIMNINYNQVLKVLAGGGFTTLLIWQLRKLFTSIQEQKQIQQEEVKNLEEILPLLEKNQKQELKLFKLKPYYFQPLTKQITIKSAEKSRYEPSDAKIVKIFTNKISYANGSLKNIDRIPCVWYAEKNSNGNGKGYQKIYGFGTIKGDFFDLKREYQPKKNLGYWTKFFNWVATKLNDILPGREYVGTVDKFKPALLGPVIGYINYELNLMKNTYILAACTIQDGKIFPRVTAVSKSDILAYFRQEKMHNYILVAAWLFGTIVIGRMLWSDIKRMINAISVKKQKLTSSYFNPEVGDDKTCIICYTNCRNMILFDCRHLIMCRECSQNYQSDSCPYCKLQIDEMKIVNGMR